MTLIKIKIMKSLEQVLKQEPVFLNDWSSEREVFNDFQEDYEKTHSIPDHDAIKVLFASYSYENYSGDAFVLYTMGGKLYELNGGHCSCYGLEGQWEKHEETDLAALEHRLVAGTLGRDEYSGNEFAKELKEFLGV